MLVITDTALKAKLVSAYHILAFLGLDDHTYTHLSIRSQDLDHFYIYPFGMLFQEVQPESLLKVSLNGDIVAGKEAYYNKTGYAIHSNIYSNRSDINAIFHIHTTATVAVSALKKGLMPLSQWALHFYNRVSYHDYDSLVLEDQQGQTLSRDLGENYVMLLRHHGAIICGRTIEEAMFYTHHLEKACITQNTILASRMKYIEIPDKICKKAVIDLLSFEENLGERDWQAWLRKIEAKT